MLNTLWMVLTYLAGTSTSNNTVILIDAYVAKSLIACIGRNIPYPLLKNAEHIEYLIPGGAKLGRQNKGGYYIKTYSDQDIKNLIKSIF